MFFKSAILHTLSLVLITALFLENISWNCCPVFNQPHPPYKNHHRLLCKVLLFLLVLFYHDAVAVIATYFGNYDK